MRNTFAGDQTIYYNSLGQSAENIHGLLKGGEKINSSAIYDYFLFGGILPPYSIYDGVSTLFPGEEISFGADSNDFKKSNPAYSSLARNPVKYKSTKYFVDQLEQAFNEHLNPIINKNNNLSLMLSGGVDSGIIASFLPKNTVAATWAGWGEESTDLKFAKINFAHFGLARQLISYVDYQKDFALFKELAAILDMPISLSLMGYARMCQDIKNYYQGQGISQISCFMGQNADTISSSYLPAVYSRYLARFNHFLPRPLFKKLINKKRKLFLLSTLNPIEMIGFFSSNALYPGPWLKVPEDYFTTRLNQLEEQIDKKLTTPQDYILMDELLTEGRRNQYFQHAVPKYFGLEMDAPYYDQKVIEIFLSVPQSLKIKHRFSKFILESLARRRGVPTVSIRKGKKGYSYGYPEFLKQKLHLPLWNEMEKSEALNQFINVKLLRAAHENNFSAFDRLLGLHYYFKYRLKI
jgi:asparagine synthetase B (glutamine-hydrolysing)